jgi:hypothetical protein
MKKFIFRILLFSIQVLFLVIPPAIALAISGENFEEIDELVAGDDKYLVGYAYNENNYKYLKWKAVDANPRHDVLAVGSSRVLQFRKDMFTSSFYNAGYTITGMNDFVPFMKSLPKEKYPKYLLMNLDQWMFNAAYDDLAVINSPETWSQSFTVKPSAGILVSVWKDIWAGKYGVVIPKKNDGFNRVGLNANVNDRGFRNDGSMYYGNQVPKLLSNDRTANDYAYADTFSRIDRGDKRFEYGDTINEKALKELDNLLKFCRENNIFVVAFLPPFADKVNEKMAETDRYKYVGQIYSRALPSFQKYGFELYDFTTLKDFGANDGETLDGFHGAESAYAKILIKMLEQNSVLKNTTSLQKLKADLQASPNRLEVYR